LIPISPHQKIIFQSIKGSSGYGTTIIYESVKGDEEILSD